MKWLLALLPLALIVVVFVLAWGCVRWPGIDTNDNERIGKERSDQNKTNQ